VNALRAMGAPPEVLAQVRANASRHAGLKVLPCNLEAVRVFWALSTQWRMVAGMSIARTGLDYGALKPVLEMLAVPAARWPGVFDSIRVLETAALKAQRRSS